MTNLRYDCHFAIRIKTHMQPPAATVDAAALAPSFRGARREMLELHAALSRVLVNFGYAIDLDSLRGNLRTTVDKGEREDPFRVPMDLTTPGAQTGPTSGSSVL